MKTFVWGLIVVFLIAFFGLFSNMAYGQEDGFDIICTLKSGAEAVLFDGTGMLLMTSNMQTDLLIGPELTDEAKKELNQMFGGDWSDAYSAMARTPDDIILVLVIHEADIIRCKTFNERII